MRYSLDRLRRAGPKPEKGRLGVLHLHFRFAISGIETHIADLAKEQKAQGIQPVIACSRLENPSYLDLFNHWEIPFYQLSSLDQICRLIDETKIGILHIHSSLLHELGGLFNPRLPVVITVHGPKALIRPGIERLSAAIAISPEVDEILHTQYPQIPHCLIENSLDLQTYTPQTKAVPPLLTYLGRVDAGKLPGIRALHTAIRELPEIQFRSISTLSSTKDLPGELISGQVDASSYLPASQVVIGTGRAIREGMAAGNIGLVLGAQYGGVVRPETVGDLRWANFSGRPGQPPKAEAIRNDLIQVLQEPDLSLWSREYAQTHFDICQAAQSHLDLYQSLLK